MELGFFSLECNGVTRNGLRDIKGLGIILSCLYIEAQGCVPVLRRICVVCLALELVGPWVVLSFSVGTEAFDELLLTNVPWSQEFSGVLRILT